MFSGVYMGKRVFITGHTGFKGTWLTAWLLRLGAQVAGYSNGILTQPSAFVEMGLRDKIRHIEGDVRDVEALRRAIVEFRPDFVFHLAAQAIVSTSYADPLGTVTTNVMGTANILDVLRWLDLPCTAVIITSDKCYENVEWLWGYKETDQLGGKDIYSGSKGAAEIIFHSYFRSFFTHLDCKVRVATGRAGNVIGGGDWASDRIVVDCMRAWAQGKQVEVRSPAATRPWQHVLEPLSGYLHLGARLHDNAALNGESFNFGPAAGQNRSVLQLLEDLSTVWQFAAPTEAYRITGSIPFNEAGLLKLNCDKALSMLNWMPTLDYAECVEMVGDWYLKFYRQGSDMQTLTDSQISLYEDAAMQRSRAWTA